jgi:hypothetical protein
VQIEGRKVGIFSFSLRSNGEGRGIGRGRYRREEDINVKYIPYSMPWSLDLKEVITYGRSQAQIGGYITEYTLRDFSRGSLYT